MGASTASICLIDVQKWDSMLNQSALKLSHHLYPETRQSRRKIISFELTT
jgi:hypothetical protein